MALPPVSSRRVSDHDSGAAATEHTPLLTGGQIAPDGASEAANLDVVADTETSTLIGSNGDSKASTVAAGKPLPKTQIFLLCYARMMEPIAFFCIFPFIAQMVQDNGNLPESDVGFYSGLIESLFSATQMLVLIFWGRLADRIGRKPVLMYSLVGMVIGLVLFGVARSIWQMIVFRCIAGVFSGSGLIIRTMIAEHSTPDTQALAFSWFAIGGNLGIFVGPLVGGALADPVTQYPSVFGGIQFFEDYPYALTSFVVGAICLTGAITSALFLEETINKGDAPGETSSDNQRDPSRMPMWELIKAPGVGFVLWIYGHVMLLAFAFTAILPVVLYTPINLGGFEFGPKLISLFMASQGAAQALWLILAFPFLQRRLGTRGVMKICGIAYPLDFASFILLSAFRREGSETSRVLFWVFGSITAFIGPGVSMSFTGVQLALNDVAPNHHVLGTLNAIALTMASAIRSVVPGLSTALYAVGVRHQIFAGHLAWIVLIPLTIIFAVGTKWLPEGRKPGQAVEHDEESS